MESIKMSSREIVKRCIEFKDPPRIGMSFRTAPINGKIWEMDDFAGISYSLDPGFRPSQKGEREWGTVYVSFDPTGENMGQSKVHPLAEGWHLMERYKFPDFDIPARYAHLPKQVQAHHKLGKYVYGHILALMTLPMELRGIENWFVDHLLHSENLCMLLDHIVDINLKIIDEMGNAGADGVIVWDDMGTNERCLVSPQIFRKIYLPRYKKITDALHERGMHRL
jgi:uroporphyrinogen decarboxylase